MKIIKIFHDGKRIGSIQGVSVKNRIMFYLKKYILLSAKLTVIAWLVVGGIVYGKYSSPEPVYAATEVKIPVILQKIAKCESNNEHYDKNGQVLMRSNTNKSVDVGRYQLNSVWFKKATELGLDITKEKDNEKMAVWIYENRGTEDWYPSKGCWSK